MIRRQDPTICCLREVHFKIPRFRVKEWEKKFCANTNLKDAGEATFTGIFTKHYRDKK